MLKALKGDFFLSKKIVTARTSRLTADRYYLLLVPRLAAVRCVRTFLPLPSFLVFKVRP